jgi:hypothetical protein
MPAIVRVAAVLLPSAQLGPFRVIVTTLLVVEAERTVQLLKPEVRATVGLAGTVKLELNVTVIVLPAPKAPIEDVVKPIVQVDKALGAVEPGANVTLLGAVATVTELLEALVEVQVCQFAITR